MSQLNINFNAILAGLNKNDDPRPEQYCFSYVISDSFTILQISHDHVMLLIIVFNSWTLGKLSAICM